MTKLTFDFSAMDFSRVCVIGSAGSGKTTFTKTFGNLLGRDVTHLDKILWGENWTELTVDEQKANLAPVVAQENWIIDGLWPKTLEMRYSKATLVIFLDYTRILCAWRAFTRALKHKGKQRDDLALGCVEKVNPSFYKYILTFNKHSLPKIKAMQQSYPNVPVVSFKNPKQTQAFLTQLEKHLCGNK